MPLFLAMRHRINFLFFFCLLLKNDYDDEIRECFFFLERNLFTSQIYFFIYYFVIIKVNSFTAFTEKENQIKIIIFCHFLSH